MIPVDMIVKHDPTNGVYGDCFRCCVASILELPAECVPHFMEKGEASGPTWYSDLNRWLFKYIGGYYLEIQSETENWLDWQAYTEANFTPYYILSGRSIRDNHSVVAHAGKIVHDPHIARSGLVGPHTFDNMYSLGFFVKG